MGYVQIVYPHDCRRATITNADAQPCSLQDLQTTAESCEAAEQVESGGPTTGLARPSCTGLVQAPRYLVRIDCVNLMCSPVSRTCVCGAAESMQQRAS